MTVSAASLDQIRTQVEILIRQISDVRTKFDTFDRDIELLFNTIQSTAADTATVTEKVNDLSDVIDIIRSGVSAIPLELYDSQLSDLATTLSLIDTRLQNIETGILTIPHDSVFEDMTTKLDTIIGTLGTPPLGQNLWSRLITITTVTTGDVTEKVRVYGTLAGEVTCPIAITVYDCLSNAVVAEAIMDPTTYIFEFYVVPGRYVVEIAGESIKTVSVTVDVPSGVDSYNMTP